MAVTTSDVAETQSLLFCGADVSCPTGDPKCPTPLDLAQRSGQRLQMEFLQHNRTSGMGSAPPPTLKGRPISAFRVSDGCFMGSGSYGVLVVRLWGRGHLWGFGIWIWGRGPYGVCFPSEGDMGSGSLWGLLSHSKGYGVGSPMGFCCPIVRDMGSGSLWGFAAP